MTESRPQGACPACDRYIGPVDVCPYCGAEGVARPVLRRLRAAAVFLGTVGLVCLWFAARNRETPAIRIGDIAPTMNFAVVRLAGTVMRDAYVSRERDYLSFLMTDGTGEIRVAVYDPAATLLIREGTTPRKSQAVDVTGTLNVSAEGQSRLTVRTAAQLRVAGRNSGGPGGHP